MKNLSLILIAFIFLQFTMLAQEGWFQQTSGTTHDLHSVYFVDNNSGWAVGDSGTILNTTDGGTNWIPQTIDTMFSLYSVHFEDNNTGWAVGSDYVLNEGVILKTIDGGTNWNAQLSGTWRLGSVYFKDNNTGWAVGAGGTILNTTDGGTIWNPQQSVTSMNLSSVFFIDNDTGWAVGSFQIGGGGGILKTTDGGDTWTNPFGTNEGLSSVFFIDNNTGWAVGYDYYSGGVILKTIDGGMNWDYQTIGTILPLSSVYFTDQDTGWVVGYPGILNTTDGGTIWNPQTSGTTEVLQSVHFVANNTGWAVGWNGTILKTITGGVIPVELTSFTASTSKGKVTLNWSTATETNNSGFEVQRKLDNNEWYRIGFVEGHGTTSEAHEYFLIDNIAGISAISLAYRLKQIDFDGSYEYSDVVFVKNLAPFNFALQQNFPNPFNPTTTIKYSIPSAGTRDRVSLQMKVYDLLGNEVAKLVDEYKPTGSYEVDFNAAYLPSGVYFYQLRAGGYVSTKKMILLK